MHRLRVPEPLERVLPPHAVLVPGREHELVHEVVRVQVPLPLLAADPLELVRELLVRERGVPREEPEAPVEPGAVQEELPRRLPRLAVHGLPRLAYCGIPMATSDQWSIVPIAVPCHTRHWKCTVCVPGATSPR